MGADFVALSLPPMLIGLLAALACALPGNFLMLRRQAMLGDSISHVVLPGIVVAFLLTGSVAAWAMMLGAGVAAMISVALIEAIRRLAGVDAGAAMGVSFTTMFAVGVLLLERSGAGGVHLDVEHALYGNLESLIWLDATGWTSLWDAQALAGLPPELGRMATVLTLIGTAGWLFWRPLVLASFDEGFAATLGLPVRLISLGLIAAAAMACVAAFSAVGSILTIAMLICPPAAARLLTNRLGVQVALSLALAAASAIGGWLLAGWGPAWLGLAGSVSAAGMIAVVSGGLLALAAIFGPEARRA
ncbi:MAG: metal ABC transporter permease [Paracoccaceae bacterium]|nr:metal ABC transporter permease [Paracoccaceae bacterium]